MTDFKHQSLKSFLLAATILASPLVVAPFTASAQVAIDISVQLAPPILPDYEQPPIPEAGYIWTPGYWYWSQQVGYYWVPGTWILPPVADVLWTPPYWGWADGNYVFHDGYWGPHVGYYGGVDYGYGYGGDGFEGGRWQNGGFVYNRTVNNFGSVHITNVYEQSVTVVNNTKVSYAGGTGGLKSEPTAQDRLAEHDHHVAATTAQTQHVASAAGNPAMAMSHNNGHPAVVATSRPAAVEAPGVRAEAPAAAIEHPTERNSAGHPAQATAPRAAEAEPARPAEGRPAATREEPPHPAEAREPPAEHAAPHPAPVATREAPPRPAPARAAPAEHAAAPPHPEEHAAARPAGAAPGRPVEAHPAPAAHPAEAHEAPEKGEEK